jgi:hypothetical protein
LRNYIRDKAEKMPIDSERQAGAELREIEVTPEMIEAGASALLDALAGIDVGYEAAHAKLVAASVLMAAMRALNKHKPLCERGHFSEATKSSGYIG